MSGYGRETIISILYYLRVVPDPSMKLPEYRSTVSGTLQTATRLDFILWMIVLTAMTVDIFLTLYGLQQGLIERNPIALFGMNTIGYAVLAFLKVPAILIGFLGWLILPKTYRQVNLIGLSLPWIGAISLNLWLIITHT